MMVDNDMYIYFFQWMYGWWYTYPSEKYEGQLGWWHSQYMEKNMFQTTNQIETISTTRSVPIVYQSYLTTASRWLSWFSAACTSCNKRSQLHMLHLLATGHHGWCSECFNGILDGFYCSFMWFKDWSMGIMGIWGSQNGSTLVAFFKPYFVGTNTMNSRPHVE